MVKYPFCKSAIASGGRLRHRSYLVIKAAFLNHLTGSISLFEVAQTENNPLR
ncbi:MAG: hypothetical protein V7K24_05075 [Nostoc sp.]